MGGRWAVAIITVAVLLFGIFVWPTPWHYFKVGEYRIVRVNRFTGSAQILLQQEPSAPKEKAPLTFAEVFDEKEPSAREEKAAGKSVEAVTVGFAVLGFFSLFFWLPWCGIKLYRWLRSGPKGS